MRISHRFSAHFDSEHAYTPVAASNFWRSFEIIGRNLYRIEVNTNSEIGLSGHHGFILTSVDNYQSFRSRGAFSGPLPPQRIGSQQPINGS